MNGYTKLPTTRYVNNNPDHKLFNSTLKLRFNTTKPIWQDDALYKNIKGTCVESLANDIFTSSLLDKIQAADPNVHSNLMKCAKNFQSNFKRFRIGRLIKDTLPKYESITPKKAARSNITMNQCRTFLVRSLRLVFKQSLASDQQSHKFVCLLLKLLCGHLPNRNPTRVELHLFKQLLRTKLQLATNIPPNLRKEFGSKCIAYLARFCCNILSHCFYVTVSKNSVIFYQRGVWNKIQNFAFAQLTVRQGLNKIKLNKEKPVSRLKLLPKSNGLRPIGVALNKFDHMKIRNARLILRYLCAKAFPYGPQTYTLNEFRTKFIQMVKQASTSRVYLATGDIIDCFNKIDYNVISDFLSNFGLEHVFHIATKTSTDHYRRIAFGVGKDRDESLQHLRSMFTNGITGIKVDYTTVTGQELRKFLRDYAFRPQVYFAGEYYQFSRGVLQGGPMSSIINEIFLLSMETRIFANHVMEKQLFYHRHVDDYIIVSNNEKIVTSIIVKLMEGKVRFKTGNRTNLPIPFPRFSSSKVFANFANPILARLNVKRANHFPFCGTVLDSRHCSLSIDYKRYEKDSTERCAVLSNRLHNVRKLFTDNIKFIINYNINRFIACYKTAAERRQKNTKNQFLSFIFKTILLPRAENLDLDIRKRHVKKFLRKQLLTVSKKLNSRIKRLSK